MRLLKNNDLSITEIAEMLQYQSINSFSKAFRKNIGISPSEYQVLYSKETQNYKYIFFKNYLRL